MLMQKAVKRIGATLVALALAGFWLYGCGSDDLLDVNNQKYSITGTVFSDGENDGLDVDVVRSTDCDDNATTPGPNEPMWNLYATVSIEAQESAPGIRLDNYRISFAPATSIDLVGNTYLPAVYPLVYHGSLGVDIASGGKGDVFITCMELDGKLYLGGLIPPTAAVAMYTVTIKMNYTDEFDVSGDLSTSRTLNFYNVDNCE
jgi:hypothetical protein